MLSRHGPQRAIQAYWWNKFPHELPGPSEIQNSKSLYPNKICWKEWLKSESPFKSTNDYIDKHRIYTKKHTSILEIHKISISDNDA